MTVLIIGYPDSGKSGLAEDLVMEISSPDRRIYIAAMIPYGEEGEERVAKHRRMREGKGFVTVEAPFDAADTLAERFRNDEIFAGRQQDQYTVLLECVSNLAANEMFGRFESPEEMVPAVTEDIRRLAGQVKNLVIVSNHFEITPEFDEETALYSCALDRINAGLREISDRVIEIP